MYNFGDHIGIGHRKYRGAAELSNHINQANI